MYFSQAWQIRMCPI